MPIVDTDRDPPSETQIANLALGRLGARRITSLTDGTEEANVVRLFYFDARDQLLEEYNWDFAILEAVLAADATAPLFDRANRFQLPSDYLRMLRPYPERNQITLDWIVQSGFIYTNDTAPLNIRYLAQINDPTRFSPSFRTALSLRLAADACEHLTQSNSKKDALLKEFEVAIANAKRIKAIQAVPMDSPMDTWLLARDSDSGGPATGFEP